MATMSPLHELTKRVFRDYVLDNDEMDLLREALRLMQPIGSCPDDEDILVTALAGARSAGKPVSSSLWDLHAVNSHAENVWRDYYNLHRQRLDELVDACLATESSSASSASGSFSDAESLAAVSSPPTSAEEASDSEDKGGSRRSATPEERLNCAAPATRATSPARSISPTVIAETCDPMDIFQEGHRTSPRDAIGEAVDSGLTIDAPVQVVPGEAQPLNSFAPQIAEVRPEPMDEDIDETALPSPPLTPISSAGTPTTRYDTPSPSPSLVVDELSSPQTPPPSPFASSSVTSGSPRRTKRLRKLKKRADEAVFFSTSRKPLSTASDSSTNSTSLPEPLAISLPVPSKHVDSERHRYTMEESMGRAGGKVTLGDLRACARFFVEHPDAASLPRDARGKAFFKLHHQRTWKAWTHIFNRFESTIAHIAEAYLASTSSP